MDNSSSSPGGTDPGPKRGRGRPATDEVVCELFQRLLDLGVTHDRAARLCKPKKPGRPKAKPESLGRPVVRRLIAERVHRNPTVAPDGFTPETLKSLSDDAVRALAAYGPESRQYLAATADKPQKPSVHSAERKARKDAVALQKALEATWNAQEKSGLFHYQPPSLGPKLPLWPKMPSTEEALQRLEKRTADGEGLLSPKRDRDATELLKSVTSPRGTADKVSENRRTKKITIDKTKT